MELEESIEWLGTPSTVPVIILKRNDDVSEAAGCFCYHLPPPLFFLWVWGGCKCNLLI